MELIPSDKVFTLEEKPDHTLDNPLDKLQEQISKVTFATDAQHYDADMLQHLIPYDQLELFGPSGEQWRETDPALQNDKRDTQKQRLRNFVVSPVQLMRGFVRVNGRAEPFLQLTYDAHPTSILAREAASRGLALSHELNAWVEVGREDASLNGAILKVPLDPETNTYKVELWGYAGENLADHLDDRGKASLARGFLQNRPDLIFGFGEAFDARTRVDMRDVNFEHTMHPLLPLTVFVAWSDDQQRIWDSRGGQNYRYQFDMKLRSGETWLKSGTLSLPYGGRGEMNYKTLFSNYGLFEGSDELGQVTAPWSKDAFGDADGGEEPFFAIHYMDFQCLSKDGALGLHRHRDNQELFFLIRGKGLIVVGDWAKFPERERCFEIRTIHSGTLVLTKGGQIHGLINAGDETLELLVMGGYD